MTYVTVMGDTWDGIAFKLFGKEAHMIELMQANPNHLHTVIFADGVQVIVPDIVVTSPTSLPPWKRG